MTDATKSTECKKSHWNINEWIESNKSSFLPPVCNKMMHGDGQLKVFFVGGPNIRKDYHLEEGEELFYQIKGDMCLKVFEHNQPKDVVIKEGEVFLLPGNVNHSPQRFENTIGLVIERERIRGQEIDGIRYFVEENDKPSANPLYEAWFYCEDLGSQLVPVINGYFASEQHKTGKPVPGTVSDGSKPLPCPVNADLTLDAPFNLKAWLAKNDEALRNGGRMPLFDDNKWQSKVYVYGPGSFSDCKAEVEVFCLQLAGESTLTVDGEKCVLKKDDSFLIGASKSYVLQSSDETSRCLVYYQDVNAKLAKN